MKASARRAMIRLAWRNVRRDRRRSSLVLAMIAVPIFGMSVAGVYVASSTSTTDEMAAGQMGNADLSFGPDGTELTDQQIREAFPKSRVTIATDWFSQTIAGGELRFVIATDARPDDPILAPMFRMTSGVAPTLPSDIAVSPRVLKNFDAKVGDTIPLGNDGATYRIVGTFITPLSLAEPRALMSPGSLAGRPNTSRTAYVEFAQGVSEQDAIARVNALGIDGYSTRSMYDEWAPSRESQISVLAAVTAAVLAETCLIAAAALIVGTRRQMRMIGVIGAAGGEPRHTRVLVVAGAALLGFVGSALGLVAGIALSGVLIATHRLDSMAGHVLDAVRVEWTLPVAALALGTVAATLAALVPAWSAARIDTISALVGRTPRPRSAGALGVWGVLATLVGLAATAWGASSRSTAILTAGIFVAVGGLLLAIPLLVGWVGRLAGRLPLGPRIAARETGRSGRRTGAAVAAATVALIAPVAFATASLADEAYSRAHPTMYADQLIVWLPGGSFGAEQVDLSSFEARLRREALPDATVGTISLADYGETWNPPTDGGPYSSFVAGPEYQVEGNGTTETQRDAASVSIGDHALLAAMHAEAFDDDLDAGMFVVLAPHIIDNGVVHVENPADGSSRDFPAVDASNGRVRNGWGINGVVVSAERAAELDLVAEAPQQVVARATDPITPEQLKKAKAVAADFPGVTVNGLADTQIDDGPFRAIFLGFCALIAAAIVAVAAALVGEESRRDRAILVAVGSSPRSRRVIDGSRTFILTALAGVLALPAGFLPVVAVNLGQGNGKPVVVPWMVIVALVVLLPAVAGMVAGLVSRRVPAERLLRPLE